MLSAALLPPDAEALRLHANVTAMLGVSPLANGWQNVRSDVAFADVRVLPPSLVSTGDVICSVSATESWLVTEAIERIVASIQALSLLWVAADAREAARRIAARISEANTLAWSETSCVMRHRTAHHEAAANVVFNQAPSTANGIIALGSTKGRHITFADFATNIVTDVAAWHDACADTIWLASTTDTFDTTLVTGGCIPIIPPDRDVSYVTKHARCRAPCGLRSLGKRYGFIATSSAEVQQGFRSLVSVGMCPLEALAVLDVDAPPPPVTIDKAQSHPENLVSIADVKQLDSIAAAKLMFN